MLVSALSSIDEAEFARLYRQWWPVVVSLCGKLLERSDDAEDAAQEAFLRAWLARDRYSDLMPFWPWLATIARRLCVDRRRRAMAEPVGDPLIVVETGPEHTLVAVDDLRLARDTLDAMRPRERHALVRREIDGWSYGRIAAVEGVTVDAVRATLKRARASLRRSLLYEELLEAANEANPDGLRMSHLH